jgi:hypothetical protein
LGRNTSRKYFTLSVYECRSCRRDKMKKEEEKGGGGENKKAKNKLSNIVYFKE